MPEAWRKPLGISAAENPQGVIKALEFYTATGDGEPKFLTAQRYQDGECWTTPTCMYVCYKRYGHIALHCHALIVIFEGGLERVDY